MLARVEDAPVLTIRTIELVSLRAIQGASTAEVQTLAERLASEALAGKPKADREYTDLAIPDALFRCAQQDLMYHPDPSTGEMITAPWVQARKIWDYKYEGAHQPMGDCDDKATFLASLLLNRRWPVRIIAAWQSQVWPHSKIINHVYPEVKVNGKWIPLEPSSKSLKFGQQSSKVKRVKIFWLSTDGGKTYIS